MTHNRCALLVLPQPFLSLWTDGLEFDSFRLFFAIINMQRIAVINQLNDVTLVRMDRFTVQHINDRDDIYLPRRIQITGSPCQMNIHVAITKMPNLDAL